MRQTKTKRLNGTAPCCMVLAVLLIFIGFANPAGATVLQLPANGDSVIGQFQHTVVKSSDTFVDIARLYDVGYNELVAANPKVDPWLPPVGTKLVIPSQYVLPNVPWEGIVVNIAEMRLYYFPKPKDSEAPLVYTFPIGIGRENFETPIGQFKVVEKMVNPIWTVPKSVLKEAKLDGIEMPTIVPPGPENPLGEHALMLDAPGYLIHGTNKPLTIGRRVSHGCLRLYPEDVAQLIDRVPRGMPVTIVDHPIKVGRKDNVMYLEVHPPLKIKKNSEKQLRADVVSRIEQYARREFNHSTWERVFHVSAQLAGIPVPVADLIEASNDKNWILRIESSSSENVQLPLADRFKELALPVLNGRCHPIQACIDLGLFSSMKLRDATAELIRYGFGMSSSNLVQSSLINDSGS